MELAMAQLGRDPIDLAVGAEVYTRDGEHLGRVKEIGDGFFKLDVRMHADYWLQTEFIEAVEGGRVTMSFGKKDADDYRVVEPGNPVVMTSPEDTEAMRRQNEPDKYGI
jgi:hypothetical protein